jgi:UDP-2,3-diacylglucosamine hydrolase
VILVLGDLHIGIGGQEEKAEKLKRIFDNFKELESVVFLGDVFDFYFECPKKVEEIYGDYLHLFQQFTKSTPVFYIQGNHDFFPLKKLEQIGFTIISRELVLEKWGKKMFFTHGDLLSVRGRITRRFLTFPLWQSLMKFLPCDFTYAIARKISRWSRGRSSAKPLKEKNFKKVEKLLSYYDIVVTAHFHRPMLRRYGDKIYANPGDWLTYFTFMTISSELLTLWKLEGSLIVKVEEVKI